MFCANSYFQKYFPFTDSFLISFDIFFTCKKLKNFVNALKSNAQSVPVHDQFREEDEKLKQNKKTGFKT